MWYKEFRIRNFKGIGELTLDLSGPATMLIGLNESGKTTILESIFCFGYGGDDLGGINPGLASLRDPDNWIPIADRANFSGDITIGTTVGLDNDDQDQLVKYLRVNHNLALDGKPPAEITIDETYHFKGSRHTTTNLTWSLKIRGKKVRGTKINAYGAKTPEWQGAVQHLKERLPRIWYFPDFLFELPDKFPLAKGAGATPEERDRNKFFQETFEQIVAELGADATMQRLLVDRLESEERSERRNLDAALLQMGRIVTDRLFGGWNRIFGRAGGSQEVSVNAFMDDGEPFLELRIKDAVGVYDLSERSLGFRWFFTFLLLTSFRKSAPATRRPVILLDEPASNLHSSAQAELLASFAKLTETAYLVYSTHSHHLIDVRWLNDAYVVKNGNVDPGDLDAYLNTRVATGSAVSATKFRKFANEHPDQTTYFQPVLDVLDYRISDLDPVREVVMVEGRTDYYLLRYAAGVVPGLADLAFLPGTGAGSLGEAIRIHLAWGRPFFVLLDGDVEGDRQSDRYLEKFGPILRGRIATLPVIAGDTQAVEVEDMLEDGDKTAIVEAVFGTSEKISKKRLHDAVAELVASNRLEVLSDEAVARFESLASQLSRLLDGQR